MKHRLRHWSVTRRVLLGAVVLFLVVLAWVAIAGGVRQLSRAHTLGQQVETAVQLACGLLSLLVVATCFWGRRWAPSVRIAWMGSLVVTAGLSALVWGPPMVLIALLFSGTGALVAFGTIRAIRVATKGPRAAVASSE